LALAAAWHGREAMAAWEAMGVGGSCSNGNGGADSNRYSIVILTINAYPIAQHVVFNIVS
jgi:hypothetical protein